MASSGDEYSEDELYGSDSFDEEEVESEDPVDNLQSRINKIESNLKRKKVSNEDALTQLKALRKDVEKERKVATGNNIRRLTAMLFHADVIIFKTRYDEIVLHLQQIEVSRINPVKKRQKEVQKLVTLRSDIDKDLEKDNRQKAGKDFAAAAALRDTVTVHIEQLAYLTPKSLFRIALAENTKDTALRGPVSLYEIESEKKFAKAKTKHMTTEKLKFFQEQTEVKVEKSSWKGTVDSVDPQTNTFTVVYNLAKLVHPFKELLLDVYTLLTVKYHPDGTVYNLQNDDVLREYVIQVQYGNVEIRKWLKELLQPLEKPDATAWVRQHIAHTAKSAFYDTAI